VLAIDGDEVELLVLGLVADVVELGLVELVELLNEPDVLLEVLDGVVLVLLDGDVLAVVPGEVVELVVSA
jgi:hypothetical protein